MKLIEGLEKSGKLPVYHIETELRELSKLSSSRPSTRILKNKKNLVGIKALIDLETHNNHSWYDELLIRSRDKMESEALFYRGASISFREMFEKTEEFYTAMLQYGIAPGDEIPICMDLCPELVYILLAANKIGAKVNSFSSNLEQSYLSEIISSCTKKIIFLTDTNYFSVQEKATSLPSTRVVISLSNSLPKEVEKSPEYEPKLAQYYRFTDETESIKSQDPSAINVSEFLTDGLKYNGPKVNFGDLDTEFLVTYTSGTTHTGHPSQIVHTNRSLIVSGRFHDAELSGNPDMKKFRAMACIHADSNTGIISGISDNLMEGWSVALEPVYNVNSTLDTLFINKPNYVNTSSSFIIAAAKQYLIDKRFHENGIGRKMPFLFSMFAAGESLSPGEEKFINIFLREARAGSGVKIKGFSMPFVSISIGGGDCEHGGIYYTLWKSFQERLKSPLLKKKKLGLMPEPFVHITALKRKGDGYCECNYGEYGIIVSNSATSFVGYKNNVSKTKKLILTDELGRDWLSNNVYGFIDEFGTVHICGRVGDTIKFENKKEFPLFFIDDAILLDAKNIMSSSTVMIDDNNLVANIQLQPRSKESIEKVFQSLIRRCQKLLPQYILDILSVRVIPMSDSYPLTLTGKRNTNELKKWGLSDTFRLPDLYKKEDSKKKALKL